MAPVNRDELDVADVLRVERLPRPLRSERAPGRHVLRGARPRPRHELDGVHHNTVVPLVNGLEQLLATPENKLGEQLQLQLRAALAHLATLYGDGPSPPQWLPGVREDITSALAR